MWVGIRHRRGRRVRRAVGTFPAATPGLLALSARLGVRVPRAHPAGGDVASTEVKVSRIL